VPEWLVLVYKIPPEPTRLRAGIWRKLKAAGAIYLQNGVTALPADAVGERVLRGIAKEVREMEGIVYLFQGGLLGDVTTLEAAYNAARDEEYTELISRCQDFHVELARERAINKYTFAELEENEDDLAKLEAWDAKIRRRDRFGAALGPTATQALIACRADLEDFATAVYRAADHGSAAPPAPGQPDGAEPDGKLVD
jgi:hypothetical protein